MTTVTDDFAGLSPAEDITNDGNWVYVVGSTGNLRGVSGGGALELNIQGSRVSALSHTALSSSHIYAQASVARLASGIYGTLGVTVRHGLSSNTFYYLEPDGVNGVYYLAKMVAGVDQWSATIPITPAIGHIFKIVVTSGNVVQAFIDQGSGFPGSPNASHDDSATSPLVGFFIGVEGNQNVAGNSWWGTWWPSPWWGSSWWADYALTTPAIDDFEAADISSGATATGNLASAVAAIAGSGVRTITAAGALASAVATIEGFQGTTTITSTGALASAVSTIDGIGYKSESANRWFNSTWWPEPWWGTAWWETVSSVLATGDLASAVATIDGTVVRDCTSAGALNSQNAAIAGSATAARDATGALSSDTAVIAGFAQRIITSDGALASDASVIVGLAQLGGTTIAIGDLASADAVMVGVSEREITSTGDLASDAATILGVAAHGFDATGDLVSDAALIDGTADVVNNLVVGDLVSDPATMQGLGFREIVARGDIRSAPATIEGFSIFVDHPTPRELLLRAVFDAFESGEAFDGMVQGQIQINLDRLTTRDLLWTALKHAGESTEDIK